MNPFIGYGPTKAHLFFQTQTEVFSHCGEPKNIKEKVRFGTALGKIKFTLQKIILYYSGAEKDQLTYRKDHPMYLECIYNLSFITYWIK